MRWSESCSFNPIGVEYLVSTSCAVDLSATVSVFSQDFSLHLLPCYLQFEPKPFQTVQFIFWPQMCLMGLWSGLWGGLSINFSAPADSFSFFKSWGYLFHIQTKTNKKNLNWNLLSSYSPEAALSLLSFLPLDKPFLECNAPATLVSIISRFRVWAMHWVMHAYVCARTNQSH